MLYCIYAFSQGLWSRAVYIVITYLSLCNICTNPGLRDMPSSLYMFSSENITSVGRLVRAAIDSSISLLFIIPRCPSSCELIVYMHWISLASVNSCCQFLYSYSSWNCAVVVRNMPGSETELMRLLNTMVICELPTSGHSIISWIARTVVVVLTVSVAMGRSLFWNLKSTTSTPRIVSSTLRVLI